jgi:hypothetical protein
MLQNYQDRHRVDGIRLTKKNKEPSRQGSGKRASRVIATVVLALSGLSTQVVGAINAGTRTTPVPTQQSIQRGFSLCAL